MRRINLDLNDPAQRERVKATWRRAVGFIPGEANQGWTAEIEGSPCRLADFDDSSWEVCDNIADVLSSGTSWAWWRTTIEVPDAIDGVPVDGGTLYFETTVDDYGEVWVNGECNLATGAVAGWNRPQRIELGRGIQPGSRFTIAVLGCNGPFAKPLGGVFMRYAILGLEIFNR
ncbi:MAG: hypothetical protein JO057_13105 [Chloroflexi bacterium]|nr:hypothetical protein [Chloroflexota bacterium]